jgi:hypothetical protein
MTGAVAGGPAKVDGAELNPVIVLMAVETLDTLVPGRYGHGH